MRELQHQETTVTLREQITRPPLAAKMVQSVDRARRLPPKTAEKLRLPDRARQLGYRWRPEIYPTMLDLKRAPNRDLDALFGEWPLPTRKPRGVEARARRVNAVT